MSYNQGGSGAAPLGSSTVMMQQQPGQHQKQHQYASIAQQWGSAGSQDQFQQQQFYQHPQAQRQINQQHLPMMYSSPAPHAMPINGQPGLEALPGMLSGSTNATANKKSVLKRKNVTNNQNVLGMSNDVRPKKQTYGMTQQNSSQVPTNSMIHTYQQQPSSGQLYQNGASMQQNSVHSPQFPSPSNPINNQHLSPYGSYDQQQLQQQSATASVPANQLHQASALSQWSKGPNQPAAAPNSRSDINQIVRMELRNTVHSRMSDGSATSPNSSQTPQPIGQTTPGLMNSSMIDSRFACQMSNGGTPKIESILSPPIQNGCPPQHFSTVTPPLQPSLSFNENNNSGYCGNNNNQQFFASLQSHQPAQQLSFQRTCSMSNVNVQPQFLSQVSLEDCKNFIKSVDAGVSDISSTTIELFDFNLSKTGFDMDNDETRLLVQKMLQ